MKINEDEESNITVAIRIRPLNSKQINSGDENIIRVQDNLIIVLDPLDIELEQKKAIDVLHRSKEQRYAFDKIYKNQNSQTIYIETVQPLIKTILKGYNSTVFAYGPTGTGKTYTMLGNQQVYGLNVLAIRDIFHSISQDNQNNYDITITYVEIYNETIRDLLVPVSGYLQLRDDPEKGIIISGVTQFKAESTQQVMNLLLIGNRRRTTQATNANQTSSRSHAVFQINVSRVSATKNTSVQTLIGKLSLIDLAGSQRGTVTENRGIRLMEGAKINRSLLALANCINALGDKNKKGFFVPYRDSKLTRLLKDSLGGSCRTVMIVNISPSGSQFEQTINTLKYANRYYFSEIGKSEEHQNQSTYQYKSIINDLRREIDELKERLYDRGDQEDNKDKLPRIQSRRGKSPQLNNNATICSCGRAQERQDIKNIKQQIFQNFNERIQLRRALMEIQQQNAINILQIRKKQGQIMLLKKQKGWEQNQKITDQIKQLINLISTLKLSTNKNTLKKQITNLQIMQSMATTKKIRDQIVRKIKNKDNRDFLEIVIKNHVLQLQNIELEINMQIQQKMINDMKLIISNQKSILQENNIGNEIEQQVVLDTFELGIQDQQGDDYNQQQSDILNLMNHSDQEGQNIKVNDFEFNDRKGFRNKSAKKDIQKKKGDLLSFKKKENQKQKIVQKIRPLDLGLKGLNLKMNIRKKK